MEKFKINSQSFSDLFWTSVMIDANLSRGAADKLYRELDELDKQRVYAEFNTGSILDGSAWILYCITRYFKHKKIIEIGTFIGKSAWAMMMGCDAAGFPCELHTCDYSNSIDIPWNGASNLIQYKKKSSIEMLGAININPYKFDLIHIDGRIALEDVNYLEKMINPHQTIVLLDDFEGSEKGVANLFNLRQSQVFSHHFLVYPASVEMMRTYSINSISTTACLIPFSAIYFANQ